VSAAHAIGSTYYFSGSDGTSGTELWKSDGTASGTVLVKDIASGLSHSNPSYFADIDGILYFSASDGIHGAEVWKSDGTASGTVLLADVYSGSTGSSPYDLTAIGETLYFDADDGVHGRELFSFDATPDTTPPAITILGDNPFTTAVNTAYVEFGATATDNIDGTLTSSITTTSTVDIHTAGTYSVTYSVTDAALNTAIATRTVIVAPVTGTVNVPQSYAVGSQPGSGEGTVAPTSTPSTSTSTPPSSTTDLFTLIASLERQLQELQARASQTPSLIFTRNLKFGDTGSDVQALQIYLNTKGFPVSLTGPGSKGEESTFFGRGTQSALIQFQEAHASEILAPAGLTKGTGFFGVETRGYVNAHL
jgi:ELWxxDGT repeat protein